MFCYVRTDFYTADDLPYWAGREWPCGPLSFKIFLAQIVCLDQYLSYSNESADPDGNSENQIELG